MRITSLICLIFLITLPIKAQSNPEIISFSYDEIPLIYDEVEQGIAAADFTWQALQVGASYRMQMHALVGGQWALIGEDFDVAKSDRLVIAHPLSFSLPHYRLSIVDEDNKIVDEAHLFLSYAETDPDGSPQIMRFEVNENTVSRDSLMDGSALLNVSWEVSNRTADTNLIFEQVLPDGTRQSIDLPRFEDWVRSEGDGVIAPINVIDEGYIMTEIKVININTGETYSTASVAVEINEELTSSPSIMPTATSELALRHQLDLNTPYLVTLGEMMTLNWDASAADGLADEVIIREWHSLYYGGKYGHQTGHIDVEGDVPYREWTALPLNGELTIQAIDEFPPSTVPFREYQNVVVYALYLMNAGEPVEEDGYAVTVQHSVYLRSLEQSTNCIPDVSAPEQAISGDGFTVSWDMCGIPFVRIELTKSNGEPIPSVFSPSFPYFEAGSMDYYYSLDEQEDSLEIHIRVFNDIVGAEAETDIRIVRP